MAQRTQVILIDDLDGTEIVEDGRSISFSVNGVDYAIDLGPANVEKFEAALAPFVEHGQRVGGRRSSRGGGSATSTKSPAASKVDPRAVRAWAQSNGIELSARGRIPAEVVEKYQGAGN
jgi:hypothetical protein